MFVVPYFLHSIACICNLIFALSDNVQFANLPPKRKKGCHITIIQVQHECNLCTQTQYKVYSVANYCPNPRKSYFLSWYLFEAKSHCVQISVFSTLLEIKTKVGNTKIQKKWQGVSTVTCDVANTSQKQIFIRVYYCP